MSNQPSKLKAFKEAFTDTFIAALVNVPMNLGMLHVCSLIGLSTTTTALVLSAGFTVWALFRKTYVRLFFEKRYGNYSEES